MDVLRALEKASTSTKPGEVEKACKKENWEVGQNADLQLFATGHAERPMDAETLSVLSLNACRVHSMAGILKALLETASELQREYERCLTPVLSKLSKGIAAIPDELLALIFKHNAAMYGRKQAIRLSHVSRKFRAVALSEHDLWTTLHSGARKEEIEAFISRSGRDTGLHIVVRNHPRHSVSQHFLETCLAVSSRWKSVEIEESFTSTDRPAEFESIIWKMGGASHLHLPRLEDLRITHLQDDFGPGHHHSGPNLLKISWTSPRLHVLALNNFSLAHSPAFAALTSFEYALELEPLCGAQIKNILSILGASPNISHLRLEMSHFLCLVLDEYRFPEVHCPSITSLDLRFQEYTFSDGAEGLIAAFIKALHVPDVQKLSLAIHFRFADVVNHIVTKDVGNEHLTRLSDALIPVANIRSSLTTLAYKFTYDNPRGWKNAPKIFWGTFPIHLDRTPNVSSLTLTTYTGVRFTREEGAVVPSRLHRLHFRGCNRLNGRGVIQTLKATGVWNSIEEFVIEDCVDFKSAVTLDAVGKDEIARLLGL
ncbi:hypothetical protein SCHPADRAFT_1002386 [Schizopora paradoxa]|uniref:F-box domain-containing protein n=1 Tax=Schizopora paradoxa TaxID=27342 RepID=A0A0H2R3J6_9AGAM|nr:hypothetical protein SCHPADRAFT_1002386 [Schizopora paradoxa]